MYLYFIFFVWLNDVDNKNINDFLWLVCVSLFSGNVTLLVWFVYNYGLWPIGDQNWSLSEYLILIY